MRICLLIEEERRERERERDWWLFIGFLGFHVTRQDDSYDKSICLTPFRAAGCPCFSSSSSSSSFVNAVQFGVGFVYGPTKKTSETNLARPKNLARTRQQSQLLNCVKCGSIKLRLHYDKRSALADPVPS